VSEFELLERDDVHALAGEVVRGGTAESTHADHSDVEGLHLPIPLFS
jgi:hypothetical protein